MESSVKCSVASCATENDPLKDSSGCKDNNNVQENKMQTLLGLMAVLGWVCCNVSSYIFVQVGMIYLFIYSFNTYL